MRTKPNRPWWAEDYDIMQRSVVLELLAAGKVTEFEESVRLQDDQHGR
jgi:hypothetical protein